MTQQAVERALGKLLTDENFRERFFENPEAAGWEAGISLSPTELDALSRLSRRAVDVLSEDLDHGTDFDGVRVEDPFAGA